jgi:hypothetical protein
MKKVFSITMTMLFLLVAFQQALIIVHFKLNQKEIEKEFCINKDKPEMQCHGKCHLKKELQKTDNTDLELTSICKKIDIILNTNYDFTVSFPETILCDKVSIYKELRLVEPYLEIFVPPPILLLIQS